MQSLPQTSSMVTDPALISGDRQLNDADLTVAARRAASGLHDLGIWQGDQVALLLRNDMSFIEASLAATLLGASPVPINWHFTPEEIAYILDDSGAKVLVAHADLLTESVLAVCGNVEIVAVDTPPEVARAYGIAEANCRAAGGLPEWSRWLRGYPEWQDSPRSVAGPMFYTSGTTGRPKGVKRKSASPEVVAGIERRTAVAWGFADAPIRAVLTGPLYHSAPNAYALQVVRRKGLLVMQPRFSAEGLLVLIQDHRITHLHMVPTMFVRLLNLPEAVRRAYDLSSLQFVTHGSAPCPPDIKRAMIDWWGPIIHEYYAMTEIGLVTASTSEEWLAHPGSVGKALPGVDIVIAEDGEIRVRSETTTRFTYHRAQDKTDAVRVGDFVATGDIGHLDDGFLYINDRKSDMIITGGVNVYPAEIEHQLSGLPGLRDCAVFGVPDQEFGERIVAVLESDGPLHAEMVRDWLKPRLSSYKMPREIHFADRLPREDSGKIKKRLLRAALLEGRL
jgi:long-chain acyl-CoA synthetase